MPLWKPKMNALFPNTTKVCSWMNKLTRLFALTCVLGSTLRRQLCSGCCYQTGVTSLHSWGASNLFYFAQVVLKRSKTVPVHSNYSPPLKNRQCTKQTRDRWINFLWCDVFHLKGGWGGILPNFSGSVYMGKAVARGRALLRSPVAFQPCTHTAISVRLLYIWTSGFLTAVVFVFIWVLSL